MEALALHTGAPTVHQEDITSFISVDEYRRFTPRVKHIYIPVCFLQEKIDNVLFIPKNDKSSDVPAYMCTKPCLGTIISQGTTWIIELKFYPNSDI